MALAERKDAKDYIGIYFTKDWTLVNVRKNIWFKILVVQSRNN